MKIDGYDHARQLVRSLGKAWRVEGRRTDAKGTYGLVVMNAVRGLLVIYSHAPMQDEREWIHVSVSKRDGTLPTWDEMMRVKALFIGDSMEAYQIAPPQERHVNIHGGTLHWWSCLNHPEGVIGPFECDVGLGRPSI